MAAQRVTGVEPDAAIAITQGDDVVERHHALLRLLLRLASGEAVI